MTIKDDLSLYLFLALTDSNRTPQERKGKGLNKHVQDRYKLSEWQYLCCQALGA
jgi:hypothetical protein